MSSKDIFISRKNLYESRAMTHSSYLELTYKTLNIITKIKFAKFLASSIVAFTAVIWDVKQFSLKRNSCSPQNNVSYHLLSYFFQNVPPSRGSFESHSLKTSLLHGSFLRCNAVLFMTSQRQLQRRLMFLVTRD